MATQGDKPMLPVNADLKTMWAYLEECLDHLMTLKGGISYSKYIDLYTVATNYCVSSRMHCNLDSSVGLGGRCQCSLSSIHPC
jgi:cullin 1